MTDHAACPDQLRDGMAPVGITISTEPPISAGPHTTRPFRCPHGVTYWIRPDGELVTRRVADATP